MERISNDSVRIIKKSFLIYDIIKITIKCVFIILEVINWQFVIIIFEIAIDKNMNKTELKEAAGIKL